MSSMKKLRGEQGALNVLLVPVILLVILFIAAAVFAIWAFNGRQDYKNNSDAKVTTAIAANTQKIQTQDAANYAEAAKNPLKTYAGPDTSGSVNVAYPKTWSAYVNTSNVSTPLDAYFHADYVPSIESKLTYNLRVQVANQSYDTVMKQYTSLVSTGKVTATPYSLPKVSSVSGVEMTGQIFSSNPTGSGTIILLPLRDTTLKIWIESPSYLNDFTTYILPNLTFSP